MKERFDTQAAEKLLQAKWELESFDDVKNWDSNALSAIQEMNYYLNRMDEQMNQHLNTKNELESNLKSTPFFLRPFQLGKLNRRSKSVQSLEQGEKEINRILDIKLQLEHWIDATPNTTREAQDVITELKLSKKQIDINKKELQLQIKQINSDTKQKINKIEKRVLFTSPKLKRLQKIKAEKKQDKVLTPLEQSLLDLEAQELEVDKMILWYEKIKYS